MKQNLPFKTICVIGDNFVGKSTLICRLINGIVDVDITVTQPDEMTSVYTVIESPDIQYKLIDIKGNPLYFMYNCSEIAKSADLILMVYDSSNIESLQLSIKQVDTISEISSSFKPIIFVGNKLDLIEKNQQLIENLLTPLINQKHPNYEITRSLFVSSLEGRNLVSLHDAIMKDLGFKDKEGCIFVCN